MINKCSHCGVIANSVSKHHGMCSGCHTIINAPHLVQLYVLYYPAEETYLQSFGQSNHWGSSDAWKKMTLIDLKSMWNRVANAEDMYGDAKTIFSLSYVVPLEKEYGVWIPTFLEAVAFNDIIWIDE